MSFRELENFYLQNPLYRTLFEGWPIRKQFKAATIIRAQEKRAKLKEAAIARKEAEREWRRLCKSAMIN
jgi:hypothetical protein